VSKKNAVPFPLIKLHSGNFYHEIPANISYEMVIDWKLGSATREFINPVESFSVVGDMFKVANRNTDYVFSYPIKQIKRAFLVPMEYNQESN